MFTFFKQYILSLLHHTCIIEYCNFFILVLSILEIFRCNLNIPYIMNFLNERIEYNFLIIGYKIYFLLQLFYKIIYKKYLLKLKI